MKTKMIAVLLLSMVMAACGESTTDVATSGNAGGGGTGDGGPVPPDTIKTDARGTTWIYEPGNPVAIQTGVDEITADAIGRDVARIEAFGYAFDADATTVASFRAVDGRRMDITWLSFVDASGGPTSGRILHVRAPGAEFSVPVRLDPAQATGYTIVRDVSKDGGRSQNMFFPIRFWQCFQQFMADVIACLSYGGNTMNCAWLALMRLINCLRFMMM
jgi:hypothetical protein